MEHGNGRMSDKARRKAQAVRVNFKGTDMRGQLEMKSIKELYEISKQKSYIEEDKVTSLLSEYIEKGIINTIDRNQNRCLLFLQKFPSIFSDDDFVVTLSINRTSVDDILEDKLIHYFALMSSMDIENKFKNIQFLINRDSLGFKTNLDVRRENYRSKTLFQIIFCIEWEKI